MIATPTETASTPFSRPLSLTIGLLGCGVVGGGVAARLLEREELLGVPVRLGRILVRDLHKPRTPAGAIPFLTTDPAEILGDPSVNIVVEAIGGIEPARTYVERALRAGKHVVTSNKALIAAHGGELSVVAQQSHAALRYEASVAGAVPVVRTLAEILSAEEIVELSGVLNGTSNFVVQAMRRGGTLDEAIALAQEAGYAEADPSDDLDGVDAARKLSVLAPLAFGRRISADAIARRSLRTLNPRDFADARSAGAAIVPLAMLRRRGDRLEALVAPVLVRDDHPFTRLVGPENMLRVVGEHSGTLTFSGHGAGREATASAVLSDLAEIARRRARWQTQSVASTDFPEKSPSLPDFEIHRGGLARFDYERELIGA